MRSLKYLSENYDLTMQTVKRGGYKFTASLPKTTKKIIGHFGQKRKADMYSIMVN